MTHDTQIIDIEEDKPNEIRELSDDEMKHVGGGSPGRINIRAISIPDAELL